MCESESVLVFVGGIEYIICHLFMIGSEFIQVVFHTKSAKKTSHFLNFILNTNKRTNKNALILKLEIFAQQSLG